MQYSGDDQLMIHLAMAYARRVGEVRAQGASPREVGARAPVVWWEEDVPLALRVFMEPPTNLPGVGGGSTRYDAMLVHGSREIYVELQTSDYRDRRKRLQQAEEEGAQDFGTMAYDFGLPSLFYKIIAAPLQVFRREQGGSLVRIFPRS